MYMLLSYHVYTELGRMKLLTVLLLLCTIAALLLYFCLDLESYSLSKTRMSDSNGVMQDYFNNAEHEQINDYLSYKHQDNHHLSDVDLNRINVKDTNSKSFPMDLNKLSSEGKMDIFDHLYQFNSLLEQLQVEYLNQSSFIDQNFNLQLWKQYLSKKPKIIISGKSLTKYLREINSLDKSHRIKTVTWNCSWDNNDNTTRVTRCGHVTTALHFDWSVDSAVCSLHVTNPCNFEDCENHTVFNKTFQYQELSVTNLEGNSVQVPVYYVHVIPNALVSADGNIRTNNLEILPRQCRYFHGNYNIHMYTKHHSEVFVISQFWGEGFFHFTIENFPRLMGHIEFLRKHTHIKIHVPGIGAGVLHNLFTLVGLDPSRAVRGTVSADIIYLPQGTKCGTLHYPNGQITSHYFHRYITQNNLHTGNRTVVLIKRSQKRWIDPDQHRQIEMHLQGLAAQYGLELQVFSDDPVPDLHTTLSMFYRAVLIMGPHGAGMTNMLFSQPGTYVLEVLCNEYSRCYRNVAFVLGMHYHAVAADRGRCEGMRTNLQDLFNKIEIILATHVKDTF